MKTNHSGFFRKESTVSVDLQEKAAVTIEISDEIHGKIFTVLKKQQLAQGKQEIKFSGNQLVPGMYMARITIEYCTDTQKENYPVKVN